MKIELLINDNDELLLSAVKKNGDHNRYELVDDSNKSWMELELKNNSFQIVEKDERITEDIANVLIKLDQLVLDVIESEQAGTENTETNNIEETSPYDPDKIK